MDLEIKVETHVKQVQVEAIIHTQQVQVQATVCFRLDCDPPELVTLPVVKLEHIDITTKPKIITYVECYDPEIVKKLPKDYEHLHKPPIYAICPGRKDKAK